MFKLSTTHSAAGLTSHETVARLRKLFQLPKGTFGVNGMPTLRFDAVPYHARVMTNRHGFGGAACFGVENSFSFEAR